VLRYGENLGAIACCCWRFNSPFAPGLSHALAAARFGKKSLRFWIVLIANISRACSIHPDLQRDSSTSPGSGDCPFKIPRRCPPKRNEAIRMENLRAQSPSLAITLRRTVRERRQGDCVVGKCQHVAPFESLNLAHVRFFAGQLPVPKETPSTARFS
jgi:hypothetical protein